MEQAPPVLSQQPTKTSEQEGDTQRRVDGVGGVGAGDGERCVTRAC